MALDRPDLLFAIVRVLVEATHPANPRVLKQLGSNAGLSLSNTFGYKSAPSYKWRLYIVKKASKRREWTSVQVRELKSLAKKKTPAGRIAKKLKRSEGATRQKAFSIGLSLDSRA